MKPNIHPEYLEVEAHCACGAKWMTKSTSKDLHLDVCSSCHPFFTGEQKFIDTAGRVEKFSRRYGSVHATRAQGTVSATQAQASKLATKKR